MHNVVAACGSRDVVRGSIALASDARQARALFSLTTTDRQNRLAGTEMLW